MLTDETKKVENFTLSYFYDDSQLLNIEQISQKEFTETTRSAFSFGYINGTTWYKLTLTNKSQNEHYVLSFLEAFSDGLNLHRKKNGVFTKSESGLSVPLEKREMYDSNPTFMLNIKSGETKTYYVEAFSKFSSAGELVIYEQNSYLTEGKPLYIAIYMFYFGSLVIVMLFNSFLYITIKDKVFAYYAAYIFFFALFILVLSGFDLYLGFEHLHEEFHVASPLVMVFLTLFSSYFLQTKLFYPKLYKVLMANVLLYAVLTPLVFINVEPWIEVVNAITTFTFILLIYIAILTSRKGYSLATYYLFIMLIYIFTLILMTSVLLGHIENNHFNRYIFMFASYLEIIIFSVILVKIYNKTKSQNKDLETTVHERTNDLKISQKKLRDINATLEQRIKEEVEKNRLQDQQLMQQSKMAMMGEMISMIAHQWRQPLNIITLSTVKLETDILLNNKISNEEIYNTTSEINKQSQYLSNTIDDFRYFYKSDKELVTVKLEDVISKSLSIIKASLISSYIEIIEEYKSKEEIELYDNEMMQVILNILNNAQDNFQEKDIKDPYIKITTENRTISICDNGGGIPEDIIEKIFDPYFSTKDEKNVTGLGLYMSKTIVEKHHNGILHVENRDDGVCFVIEI